MVLVAWRTSRLTYEFNRDTSRYQRRMVRFGVHIPMNGLGAVERTREHGRVFFCLYRWQGRIYFQAGPRCWRLDQEGLRFQFRAIDRKTSEFCVLLGNDVVFRCSYRHWLRARLLGVTGLDSVDFERDHFLAHVAGQPLPLTDLEGWEDAVAPTFPTGDEEPAPEGRAS